MQPRSCHPMRALALALSIACAAGAADGASDCAGLVNVKPEGATITSASAVSGPSTIGGARVAVPFCRVEGVAQAVGITNLRRAQYVEGLIRGLVVERNRPARRAVRHPHPLGVGDIVAH